MFDMLTSRKLNSDNIKSDDRSHTFLMPKKSRTERPKFSRGCSNLALKITTCTFLSKTKDDRKVAKVAPIIRLAKALSRNASVIGSQLWHLAMQSRTSS
jgi:hypothetical protein